MSIISFWKKTFSNQPWVKYDYGVLGDTPRLVDCNNAWLLEESRKKQLHEKLQEQIINETTLKPVETIPQEPYLKVIHSGIEKDGRIKMELDWNIEFIKLLENNGFFGDNEEEVVQRYLISISNDIFSNSAAGSLPNIGVETDIMETAHQTDFRPTKTRQRRNK